MERANRLNFKINQITALPATIENVNDYVDLGKLTGNYEDKNNSKASLI